MQVDNRFLADGDQRLRNVQKPQVRAEVEQQYADRLAAASWFERRKIRKQIKAEIKRRLNELSPPDALY